MTDRWLARLVGITVCLLALLAVGSMVLQVARDRKVDADLHDLVVLLAGGLLGRLTTTRQAEQGDPTSFTAPSDATVNVAPAPPTPPDSTYAVGPPPA